MKSNSMKSVLLILVAGLSNTLIGQEFVPGEIVVKFDEPPARKTIRDVEQILGPKVQWRNLRHAPHARAVPDQPHPLSFFRIATVDEQLDIEKLCHSVSAVNGVAFACLNRIPAPTYTPNDAMFGNQWAHQKIDTEGPGTIPLETLTS